ncbi:Syringofactin operon regulator SyfR [Pseudomonas tremae]|uniref:Syringofactin operon regulator SyfR n=1 Tax=Pseudomonas tremae TaxID=200454 RepID=A0AA40NZR7_9PSED|nr:Syringofactin operon regulator SyfR [Pseudomonas tremae]
MICFHRLMTERAFSLAELSVLKSLSGMLPLLGQHAQSLAQQASLQYTGSETEAGSLDPVFSIKLAQEAVTLSAREQEVCIGLLTGGTVSQMAQRLKVKNSSVETYLKRATAKLGVSGRHGLARWIAERLKVRQGSREARKGLSHRADSVFSPSETQSRCRPVSCPANRARQRR